MPRPDIFTTTRHCLVDLETLDVFEVGTPAVFEIGLVLYNPFPDPPSERFVQATELSCNPLLAAADGFSINTETIHWHLQRRPLDASSKTSPEKMVHDAHALLSSWKFDFIWARGTDFDLSILKSLFAHYRTGPAPWKYWQQRDLRTLSEFHSGPHTKKPHRALRDCLLDAEILGDVIRAHSPHRINGDTAGQPEYKPTDLYQVARSHLKK